MTRILADTTDLICNTFAGWNTNIEGDIQIACPLPDGAECEAYSATSTLSAAAQSRSHGPWRRGTYRLESASRRMATSPATLPDNSAGTYEFTLQVDTADGLTATSDQEIVIAPGCAAPSPSPSPTAVQPTAVPTAVAAGIDGAEAAGHPAADEPDGLLPTMLAGLMLLASGVVLTAIVRRRRH